MALRVSIGNPFRPPIDGSKWQIRRSDAPVAWIVDADTPEDAFVVHADRDAPPAPDEVGLLIGRGPSSAAELLGDELVLYDDEGARFLLTRAGEVVDLSRTSALEIADWRAHAPGQVAAFDGALFAAVADRATDLVVALGRQRSALDPLRRHAPLLRPPSRLAQGLAERLFPHGLWRRLQLLASGARLSLLCEISSTAGGLFGPGSADTLGLYLQPSATPEGHWGLFSSVDVGAVNPRAALNGPLSASLQIIGGDPARLHGPVRTLGRGAGTAGPPRDAPATTAGGGLLVAPATIDLQGLRAQLILRDEEGWFLGFQSAQDLTLPVEHGSVGRWPMDLALVMREVAQLSPSYALAILAAFNPGLKARLLATAQACTLSLFQPRFFGPLNNLGRIDGALFQTLGVDGPWVRFAPRDERRTLFRFVAGFADRGQVSIESLPGAGPQSAGDQRPAAPLYLRALQSRLVPCLYADDPDFRRDASFDVVRGLASPLGISLRTREEPPRYVVASNVAGDAGADGQGAMEIQDFHFLALEPERPDRGFRDAATFFLETRVAPPPHETAVLRLGDRLTAGDYRRSGDGHYFLTLTADGTLAVFAGSGPHGSRGRPWASEGGRVGLYSARMDPHGILVVVREDPTTVGAAAATLAASQEVIVWQSEVWGQPGDCFAAVLSSGQLAVFRGTPEDPGELVWSSQRGPVHWAQRRVAVAVATPHGLVTVTGGQGDVRADGTALGYGQSLELHELWDGRVALRALDRTFVAVYRDAVGTLHVGSRAREISDRAGSIFTRAHVAGAPALRTPDGQYLAVQEGRLTIAATPVALRILELPLQLVSHTGRAFEIGCVEGGLQLTVDSRSPHDGATVLARPRTGFSEQAFRLLYQSADDTFALVAVHSAKCLEIADASVHNGAPLVQATPNGHTSQRFALWPAEDGSFFLLAAHSGQALTLRASDATATTAAVEQRALGAPATLRSDRPATLASRFYLRPTRAVFDRALAIDISGGRPPAAIVYREARGESAQLDGLLAGGNVALVGDFMGLRRDQLLCLCRGTTTGAKLRVFDLASGRPPLGELLREDWGDYDWLDGWLDANDWYLVGDFMALGHDQLVLMNRGGSLGRVMIADLAAGHPVQIRYWESWGESMWLNGWQDDGDVHLAGDFMGLGHDQWLTLNRGGQHGRIRISDVRGGRPEHLYVENYGDSALFDGWMDVGDVLLAGDFLGRGYDQLLCIDRHSDGRGGLMIASFKGHGPGKRRPPADVLYSETWASGSARGGWFDAGDVQIAGDFRGDGFSQLLCVNRSQTRGGKLAQFAFTDGHGIVQPGVGYQEAWGQSIVTDGFGELSDVVLAGDFAGRGHAQLLLAKRR